MRNEEIRKIQYEMSSEMNHVPNQDHGTNAVDRSAQYDQNVDRSSDSDDGNNLTNKLQPAEEEAWQDEPNEITPLNKDTFTGTMACPLMRHNSLQPASLTKNCLTRFHWATEAFEKIILYGLLSHSLFFLTLNVI